MPSGWHFILKFFFKKGQVIEDISIVQPHPIASSRPINKVAKPISLF